MMATTDLHIAEVLLYGASGAIGSAAVQLARIFGAQVTSASSVVLRLVSRIGAC